MEKFEKLLQTNEVYRDVLGKWGAEITRNFISKALAQSRIDTLEEVRQWAKEHNLCSDLVATSSLMRFLDSLKKGKI